MRHLLVGIAVTALFASCGGDSLPTSCFATAVPLGANALTLRPDARLDRVGAGFVLLAATADKVLAETVGTKGEPGPLVTIPVPVHSDGPWVGAVAGAAGGVSLVVAYAANPSGGTADLMTFTAGGDGSAPSSPVAVGKIPDKALGPVVVSAGSGRGGAHVGIAWGVPGVGQILAKVLGADGSVIADLPVAPAADFDCLRFGPGKEDLTVSYTQSAGTPLRQSLHVSEILADGTAGQSFSFTLSSSAATGCPAIAPSVGGYGVAWKEVGTPVAPGQGDFFALYDQTVQMYVPSLVLSNPRAVGGDAPPIVGVGTSGNRFTLLFAQATGAHSWEVDFQGRQVAAPVTYPSSHGNIGAVSVQPVGSSLFATYADYGSSDPANQATGDRLFVELTCR